MMKSDLCLLRVPRTSAVLLPLLANMFPFYLSDVYVLQCYVHNLLQLTVYLPKSRGRILRIIFVELTKVDVSLTTAVCFGFFFPILFSVFFCFIFTLHGTEQYVKTVLRSNTAVRIMLCAVVFYENCSAGTYRILFSLRDLYSML